MSWSSLFAFSNPNGRIGSTYNATFTTPITITATPIGASDTIIADIISLPVGVYSLNGSFNIFFSTNGTIDDIIIYASNSNAVLIGGNIVIPVPTNVVSGTPLFFYFNIIFSVTDTTMPINIFLGQSSSTADILVNTSYIVATKLA